VDNVGDIVTELAGEGTDTVKATVNYTLSDNVENLTLTGTEGLTGKGNLVNNIITGNTGNNRIFGYGGNDNLIGGAGNDSLFGGVGNDTVNGGTGNDYLSGGVGNDNLTGGTGQDILMGGTGKDNFTFLTPTEGLDIITDFSIADDTIRIKTSAFGFNSLGAIAAGQLVTGEGAIAPSAPLLAIDSDDYFVYDNSTGILSFDSDANGELAPVPLVILDNAPAITNADIVLF
jgi:Ca2+-binding RTX toxin-like protein